MADGLACCGDTCSESWDCFSGLNCNNNVCMLQNETTNMLNMSDPVCDECDAAAIAASSAGGAACMESC